MEASHEHFAVEGTAESFSKDLTFIIGRRVDPQKTSLSVYGNKELFGVLNRFLAEIAAAETITVPNE